MKFAMHPIAIKMYSEHQMAAQLDRLMSAILDKGRKYWLLQRSLVNHLFTTIHNTPSLLPMIPDTLTALLTLREFRGYDASLLVLWDVPVLNQCRDRLPHNSDLQGAYPRYMMLQLMVLLVNRVISRPSDH